MRWIFVMLMLLMSNNIWADSSYDRTIQVMDQTRDEAVRQAFREMIAAYTDEDARSYFDLVSEDRFEQDYITFSDAIYNDFRLYDIMQVDFWFEGIVPVNQVGRILTVRWEERYESLESSEQFETRGLSRFTYDEIDGEFYLIRIEGNNLFGISSQEWSEEVPPVAGQEQQNNSAALLPDVIPVKLICDGSSSWYIDFDIKNISNYNALGMVDYTLRITDTISSFGTRVVNGSVSIDLSSGQSSSFNQVDYCQQGDIIELMITPHFQESNTDNNSISFTAP